MVAPNAHQLPNILRALYSATPQKVHQTAAFPRPPKSLWRLWVVGVQEPPPLRRPLLMP
jgi:hypothetical protein